MGSAGQGRRVLAAAVFFLAPAPGVALAGDTWTSPHPGIRQLVRTAAGPLRVFALEVDLCHDGVSARATKSGERQRTVSSFGDLVGAEAAVNGDFFSYADYSPSGLAVGGGEHWPGTADDRSMGVVAFGRGRAIVSPPGEVVGSDPPPAWMMEVVSGRRPLVVDGVPMAADDGDLCTARHPRTAAGLSRDGRTLVLAVVDGRSDRSRGMYCTELGDLMAELGAWNATNLDGGGSSTLWVRGNGVVNDPSDGAQRVVANHLAILASGRGDPGSCDRSWEEAAVQADASDGSTTTDIDGDGGSDLCARAAAGIRCALSAAGGFGAPFEGPPLADAAGWDDPANHATLRMGDLDGDGRADLCARADDGMHCWISDGAGFPQAIVGPPLSDAAGWSAPRYYGSLRLADVDGDHRDDLCARSASDFRCYPSTGDGFGPPLVLADLSDEGGWADPSRYGTIRMGDIDGDGRTDLCARAQDGMKCWRSTPDGWGPAIAGPAWSDSGGWGALAYWSTIRLADVDGDGRADLCARAAAGFRCHPSAGEGFGEAVTGPAWSDDSGWSDYSNFSTIRMADVDGDGADDVCARADAGIRCHLWDGAGHSRVVTGPELSDAEGWNQIRFYSTIRLADPNADGRADVCARSSAGVRCWLSDGSGFPEVVSGPAWTDDSGWGDAAYYETFRAAPAPRREPEEPVGVSDADAGSPSAGNPGWHGEGDHGDGPAGLSGCSCNAAGAPAGAPASLLLVLVLALQRQRTRTSRTTAPSARRATSRGQSAPAGSTTTSGWPGT